MAARWIVSLMVFASLLLVPRPGAAETERSLSAGGIGRGFIVHLLFRRPVAPAGARYDNRSEPLAGLWQQPVGPELERLYAGSGGERRRSQAVPLLLIEW